MRIIAAIFTLTALFGTAAANSLLVLNSGYDSIFLVKGDIKVPAFSPSWERSLGWEHAVQGTKFVVKHVGVQTAQCEVKKVGVPGGIFRLMLSPKQGNALVMDHCGPGTQGWEIQCWDYHAMGPRKHLPCRVL